MRMKIIDKLLLFLSGKKKRAEEIIEYCEEKQRELFGSCAVFFPDNGDEKIFKTLRKMGIFTKEPLEGGYMFSKEYNKLYEEVDHVNEISGDENAR
ncbi:MAG TPA: hypothetical protein ENF81_01535 [Thermotogaceae bacterium]|nr:hypothetical protein [Thermotogaceae bacterium]